MFWQIVGAAFTCFGVAALAIGSSNGYFRNKERSLKEVAAHETKWQRKRRWFLLFGSAFAIAGAAATIIGLLATAPSS